MRNEDGTSIGEKAFHYDIVWSGSDHLTFSGFWLLHVHTEDTWLCGPQYFSSPTHYMMLRWNSYSNSVCLTVSLLGKSGDSSGPQFPHFKKGCSPSSMCLTQLLWSLSNITSLEVLCKIYAVVLNCATLMCISQQQGCVKYCRASPLEFLIQQTWDGARLICVSGKFPGNIDSASPDSILWEPLLL